MTFNFPQFGDDNVEIYLSSNPDDKLVLHSYVLALHSPWFKASLSERWNSTDALSRENNEDINHWVYELRFDKNSAFGLLTRRSDVSEPQSMDTDFIDRQEPEVVGEEPVCSSEVSSDQEEEMEHTNVQDIHSQRLAKIEAHRQLLGALYHIAPNFSGDFGVARCSILQLSEIAKVYGALNVIKAHVESYLGLCQRRVVLLCESNPHDMLELATAINSGWIFKEAGANLIALSTPSFHKALRKCGALKVQELVSKKRQLFKSTLRSQDLELFQLRHHSVGQSVRLSNMVEAYFLHWLSENLKTGHGSNLVYDYARVYRTIARIASGKICDEDVTEFRIYASSCAVKVDSSSLVDAKRELEAVFKLAADSAKTILTDVTMRQVDDNNDYRALTFVAITDDELPWAEV